MKTLTASADFTERLSADMKRFPKATSCHMDGFQKAAELDNFWQRFVFLFPIYSLLKNVFFCTSASPSEASPWHCPIPDGYSLRDLQSLVWAGEMPDSSPRV
jgi:hypothetical protein